MVVNNDLLLQWFSEHHQALFEFLCRVSGDYHLSQDLAQETYVRAYLKFHLYQPQRGTLKNWLYQMAINLYKDYRRSLRREQKMRDELRSKMKCGDLSDQEYISEVSPSRLNQALAFLAAEKRIIILLALGHKLEDVAQILSIPVGTAKSRLYYARKSLALLLKKDEEA